MHPRLEHERVAEISMDERNRAERLFGIRDKLAQQREKAVVPDPGELPVVARLMVEIRSDGSTTVARGAMEDLASGQKVAVEATGSSPLSLALSLAKSIAGAPFLARQAFRALMRR
jgi:hypothetical protein